jgi:hypothetical protein
MNCTPSTPEMAEKILDNIGKLKVADHARLMADNQATLDRSNRSDEAHRDYSQRVREAQAKQVFGGNWEPPIPQKAGDDPMQIFIDSPITVSQPERQPPANQPPPPAETKPSLAAKALPWLLAGAAGLGGAGLAGALIDREPAVEMPQYDVEKWVPE